METTTAPAPDTDDRRAKLRADLEALKAEAGTSSPAADHLRRIGQLHAAATADRITALLAELDATLQDQQEQAAADAAHYGDARMIRNQQFHEGRTAAFHQARHLAQQILQTSVYGITPGNTRQQNAAAFAETIINGTTNGIGVQP